MLERPLEGEEVGHRRWTSDIASCVGADLYAWHTIPEGSVDRPGQPINTFDSARLSDLLSLAPLHGICSEPGHVKLFEFCDNFIDECLASGSLVVSHGDINPHNIILTPDKKIGWIDLDAVCIRSAWYDLSMALLKLFFHQEPEVIDAFLRGYFAGRSVHRGAWDAAWLKWFVLCATINAVKWGSIGGKRRWGEAEDNGYKDLYPLWSKRALFIAATALRYLGHPRPSCAACIRKIAEETTQQYPA